MWYPKGYYICDIMEKQRFILPMTLEDEAFFFEAQILKVTDEKYRIEFDKKYQAIFEEKIQVIHSSYDFAKIALVGIGFIGVQDSFDTNKFNDLQLIRDYLPREWVDVYNRSKGWLDLKTERLVHQLANYLKKSMNDGGITANKLLETGQISKNQLYSVLRMGNPSRPNYSISTLAKVLSLLNLEVELHEKKKLTKD